MAEARHYCVECDTHFGGRPNYVSPEEHIDIAHEGCAARIVEDGDFRDWQRKEQFRF